MHEAMLGPLLGGASKRLRVAAIVVLLLWAAVLWAAFVPVAPPAGEPAVALPPALRLVVASGRAPPSGGAFERFDVPAPPIAPPVNARGHVAFYPRILRAHARAGIFAA